MNYMARPRVKPWYTFKCEECGGSFEKKESDLLKAQREGYKFRFCCLAHRAKFESEHKKTRKEVWTKFNQKESTKIYKRKWLEHKNFSDNATLLTGDNKCYMCGSIKSLVIHHKDGNNGRHGRTMNNSSENLVILCRKCHPTVHSHGFCKEVVSND